nr:hypothetical protein [uncultured Ottowia sp.]
MGHGLIPFRRSKKHGYKATAQSSLKSGAVMFSDCARQRISDASFLIQPHIAPFAPVFSVFIQVTCLNAEWIQRFQPLLACAAIKNPAAVFRGRAAQGALARAARGIRIIKTGANTEGEKAVLRTFF